MTATWVKDALLVLRDVWTLGSAIAEGIATDDKKRVEQVLPERLRSELSRASFEARKARLPKRGE